MEKRLEALEVEFQRIHSRIQEAAKVMPSNIALHNRISGIEESLRMMANRMQNIAEAIGTVANSDRYIEDFTDEEIQHFYKSSSLSAEQVKEMLKDYSADKADLTVQMVYKYVNGEMKDLKLRSFIGKKLREASKPKAVK